MSETPTYTIAHYLFDRLAELGCEHVFGVPGDYNMPFLDVADDHPQLQWVGNANELNAAYAADAYARAKGIGALVTTYGVGELSAINGIAGSFAEYAPVLHIVGAPKASMQSEHQRLHHSLGDGDFDHFHQMHKHVTVASAVITPQNAPAEIDRVLREVVQHSRPGYLLLAPDIAAQEVYRPADPLQGLESHSSPGAVAAFREAAAEMLDGKRVSILADLLVHRLKARDHFDRLVAATEGVPLSTLAWGKSLVDESSARFAGIYAGAASQPHVRECVEDAEVVVCVGVLLNDTTSAGFTQNLDPQKLIDVTPGVSFVGERAFSPLRMADAIDVLTELAEQHPWRGLDSKTLPERAYNGAEDEPIRQDDLWGIVAEYIKPGQSVLADQGTAFFGIATERLPKDAFFIGQPMWGSIGYTLPAALGVAIARPEDRAVLLIGDGSAQLTVQEIGTMLREKVNPIIVLINNNGYTVERAIHGPERGYNDIVAYDWAKLPEVFGGNAENYRALEASTPAELRSALQQAQGDVDKLVLLQVHTKKMDLPVLLRSVARVLQGKPPHGDD
ncbi:alpha-keto acid decarboxylase family protein [Corynebacterium gerontici]|uniref:Alpha-keto-acid decarboxylase n=1 Tax=Corynebacterium gerontici TaxID=2079234 RepID=A0A3G6J1J4_9CORY|nr:thiamine pyrophosphate-binding protein [Corynebacterium gerontici]AZA11819.1 Alpha-keto-acid decarboxylase [Corynebacterium gerontici]